MPGETRPNIVFILVDDLGKDIGEAQDISVKEPERASALREKLERWRVASGAAIPERRRTQGTEKTDG